VQLMKFWKWWIHPACMGLLLAVAVVVIMSSTTAAEEPAPQLNKLDALLAGVATPNSAPSQGDAQPAGAEPEHQYVTVERRLDSLPFHTDAAGNVFVDALIKTDGSREGLDDLGITVRSQIGAVVSARIPVDSLEALAGLPNVTFVESARPLVPANDASGPAIGAPGFRTPTGEDGSGVIVGVIDTGADIFHSDFRNADGTTRIKFICDQTDPPQGGDDTCPGNGASNGGTLWTEAKINATLSGEAGDNPVRQQDTIGHGSHVMGTAAGNDATYGGVAPGADLIVVNTTLATTDIIDGMSFIDQRAAELGLPYVINISLGNHIGPHDGTDLWSQAIDEMVGPGKPGKAIVTSAGNAGHSSIHASGSVNSGGTTSVGFEISEGTEVAILSFWYHGQDSFCAGFLDPDGQGLPCVGPGQSAGPTCREPHVCLILGHSLPQQANGSAEVFLAIIPYSNNSTIGLPGAWSINLGGQVVNSGTFDGWVTCQPSPCGFLPPHGNTDSTVGQPGVARNVISVASYVTKECWTSQAGEECYGPPFSRSATLGDISFFSSKGPTRDGRIKPDIAAPGQAVVSTLSSNLDSPNICVGTAYNAVAPSGVHSVCQGTSMASPQVAGAVALWLAVDPTLDSEQIKERLQQDAIKDSFTGNDCNNTWGCGKLNLVPPLAAVPPNNEVDDATVIPALPFSDSADTTNATTAEDDPDCFGRGPTVWYEFTPEEAVRVEADTFGSDYDTTLSVYTGSRGALNQIACNDDAADVLQSRVSFDALAGETYLFMVGAFGSKLGGRLVFSVDASAPPPSNDDFANALVIPALPFSDSADTTNATTAEDDPDCFGRGPTVWYEFTPEGDVLVSADTIGSDYDTTLSVYTGSRGALAQIACNDDAVDLQSVVQFEAAAGETYFFMVGAFGSKLGGRLVFSADTVAPPQ
jgi:hypothetical protein